MDIILQFTPNNEVRLSLQKLTTSNRKRTDSLSIRDSTKYAERVMAAQVEVVRGFSSSVVLNTGGTPNNVIVSHSEADATELVRSRSLDFINEVQQQNKLLKEKRKNATKPGYGTIGRATRFTRNARRRIISAGSVLEARCSDSTKGVLVTCTLPGASTHAVAEFPKWSGYLVNRCLQRVRASFATAARDSGSRLSWFYSWEVQKRGALHIHLCLWTDESALSRKLGYVFKDAWEIAIKDVSTRSESDLCTKHDGRSCWLPQYWQNDVSVVRKSVARYISKYVSKDSTKSSVWYGARIHPSRWWGMDRLLTQEVESQSPKIKARALSESRAVGLYRILAKEIADMGISAKYHWNADIGNNGYHVGWAMCSGFYLNADIFMSAQTWLLELFTRSIADIDYSLIEYRNYDPLPSYVSEVANGLLEV